MGRMAISRSEMRKAYLDVQVAGSGQTTQTDDLRYDQWTPEGGIRPPLNLDFLAGLTHISRYRRSCIAAVTLNTVGHGFELKPKKGAEQDLPTDPEDYAAEIVAKLDGFAARDARLGAPDFLALLSAAKWDEQECGQGAIEFSRNSITGEIDGAYHVPGKRIRRRVVRNPDGTYRVEGWIMGPRKGSGPEITRFYDFGDKVQYDDDGRPTSTLKDSGRRWDTNELLVFQLYTSASRDYGLPPDYQLANDYLGDKLAGETNVGYFDGSGVPPTVVFIQGKEADRESDQVEIEIDPKFVRAIANTLRSSRTQDRVALVPVPAGTKTDAHQLAVLSERDLGYVGYRSDNRRATLGAWRLSPVFVADIEDAGKYTAEVERGITKEQVFDPEQRRWEGKLNRTLLAELAPELAIHFHEIAIEGNEQRRQSANDAADRGTTTRREFREAHGLGPLPEADQDSFPEPGQVPHGWNDAVMTARTGAPPITDGEIAKLSKRGDLAATIRGEFEGKVDEAIEQIQGIAPGAILNPVVLTKQDDGSIVIERYHGNGDGPDADS